MNKEKIKDEIITDEIIECSIPVEDAISKTAKAIFEDLSRTWVGGSDENGEPVKGKREFYDFDYEELRKKWCD